MGLTFSLSRTTTSSSSCEWSVVGGVGADTMLDPGVEAEGVDRDGFGSELAVDVGTTGIEEVTEVQGVAIPEEAADVIIMPSI